MDLKKFLPVALAGLIGVSTPACKPAQERHREDVNRILESVQPTEYVVSNSLNYYESRDDLKNVSSDKRASLVLGHARLSVLSEQIKTGGISIQSLLTILKSHDRIITDENTKLKIATNFGRGVGHLYSHDNELELWTEDFSPNKILRNFTTQVDMDGGELKVSFSGTEFETKARGDKEQLSASTNVVEVGPATYTISIGLVLAQ